MDVLSAVHQGIRDTHPQTNEPPPCFPGTNHLFVKDVYSLCVIPLSMKVSQEKTKPLKRQSSLLRIMDQIGGNHTLVASLLTLAVTPCQEHSSALNESHLDPRKALSSTRA